MGEIFVERITIIAVEEGFVAVAKETWALDGVA